jgi:hypothetical protein
MLMFSSEFRLALVSFGMLQSNSLFADEILDGFDVYQRVLTSSILFQLAHVDFGPFIRIILKRCVFQRGNFWNDFCLNGHVSCT